ncbi:Ppx/GppA phosphatase family protein [Tumidithrix helvetica PCC 7403]|uniref:Ppx/GppA phosphatase family protein n=1 Tax=Tumidithrix helvetica TaxID=3457545 RepID=UPI003CA88FC9
MPQDRILAAIDIGTNSIHMVVVRVKTHLPSMSIIAAEKATVRLGERCAQTGKLLDEAMERSLEALARCQEICRAMDVEEIIIVATSATRESPNGLDFIRRIEQELGLRVEIISGQEEARRIYLGVLSAMELQNQPHVVIDIGGGSTELILGDGHDPLYLSSTKVGAVRLTDQFIKTDPISILEFERLQNYIRGMLERPIDELKQSLDRKPAQMIGTSGTIETLATLHAKEKLGSVPNPLQGYEFSFVDLESMVARLRKLNLADRTELLKQKRAEIILAGALVLQEAMRLLGATKIVVCQRSLREGLIVDWMIRQGFIEDRLRYQSSVRDRSVLKLADKYSINLDYAKQVARMALSLFDQTQGVLHEWGQEERSLLWAAAMLHNSGHHINNAAHHKHSYYLIRNGELLGYTETEIEAIANLARYHRKSEPKKKHENFQKLLNDRLQLMVRQLSTLLRLAVALDRRQVSGIASVEVLFYPKTKTCHLQITPADPTDSCALELWSLEYKKQPFEAQFNYTLTASLKS